MTAPDYLGLRVHDTVEPIPTADKPRRAYGLPPRDHHPPTLWLGRDGIWRCGACHEDAEDCTC